MTAPKNPKPYGLPISIPASQALANLEMSEQMDAQRAARRAGTKVIMTAFKPAEGTPVDRLAADRQPTKAESDAAAVHDSCRVGDVTPSEVNLNVKDMPGPLLLEVAAIDCYDHNPRLFANEKAEDIEASIRANGYTDALVVTRRREGDRFMLAAGSNTSLRVLQDLWQSTQDERYRWVNCIYQPYESDSKLLAQHLGENLNRGDMRFWEVAKGMVVLADGIEAEGRKDDPAMKTFGMREQVDALTKRGLRANKSDIALWRFATQFLSSLADGLRLLTNRAVRDHLQPRLNALKSLAARFRIDEATYWASIVHPTLEAYGQSHAQDADDTLFDAATLCDQIEAAFAENVGESVASIRQMLSMLKLSPTLTLADLRMPSPNLVVGRRPARVEAPVADAEDTADGPSPVAHQPQLPLGPGPAQVRGDGINPPAARPALSPTQTRPAATGPLFADAQDALQALHAEVQSLLASAGLEDTLRWRDEMPLGFFIDMPDRAIHARQPVMPGSPEFEARAIKTVVWWSLVLMTGQFREGVVPFIDQASPFFRAYSIDEGDSPLKNTDIEAVAPELDEMLMYRLTPGRMQLALRQLRLVEDAAATMFAQLPDRWRRMLEVMRR